MSLLRLRVLGRLEVEHAGQAVQFRTRKMLALLLYLALEGGWHSRSKLAVLLWPDSDEDHGRMALRGTLMHLRIALQESPTSSASSLSMHLRTEGIMLQLETRHELDLDLLGVQQAWQVARTLERRPIALSSAERDRAMTSLRQGLSLVRGPFCSEFAIRESAPFEEWMSNQRTIWHLRLHLIYDQLARLFEEGGDLEQAKQTLLDWINFDPMHEEAIRRVMQVQQALGDRIAAIQIFERYRHILWEELQARPSTELVTLARQLKTFSTIVTGKKSPPSLVRLEMPLVGREEEFGTLCACYRRVNQAEAQVVVLQGVAGIGKTRLANEFARWARSQGAEVLQGQAFETSSKLPYLPIIELLRRKMEQERAPEDLLDDLWLSELSRLLPELRERYPDLTAPTSEPPMGQVHLFEAVARVLHAWAQRHPLVLLLDDLQWMDIATLDVLRYLQNRWSKDSTAILLILCLRIEALAVTPTLDSWLRDCQRWVPLTRLLLYSLTEQDTQRIIFKLQGQEKKLQHAVHPVESQGELLGQWLYRETEGHPFFLLETLKALLDQGALIWQCDEQGVWYLEKTQSIEKNEPPLPHTLLPQSIRGLIVQRVSRLSVPAQRLLQAGAVLGDQFRFALLRQIAGLSEEEGLEALEDAIRAQLICEIRQPEGMETVMYSFSHEKVRKVIYLEMSHARREQLRQRALELSIPFLTIGSATSTLKILN